MPLGSIASVCVFGGASRGRRPAYHNAAEALGGALAAHGVRITFGGGHIGLMGVTADAATAAGGTVIGVIPRFLFDRELGHTGITELRIVDSMHTRKATMDSLADAFVVLPGGVGTLEEALEVITWRQLGLHDKPIVFFDVEGYWARFAALIESVIAEGFAAPATATLFSLAPDVAAVLAQLAAAPAAQRRADPSRL